MIRLFKLSENGLLILSFLSTISSKGCNQRSITVKNIMDRFDFDKETLIETLLELKIKGYIYQISKDGKDIFWNNPEATYKICDEMENDIIEWLIFNESETKVVIKEDYIWYAVYGSSVCYEKFIHHIVGGIFAPNHTQYEGCKDTAHPIASRQITIPYRGYIGGSSPLWQYSGTMFLDYIQRGETLGRMYLIKRAQYEEIRDSLGRGNTGYNKEINIGEYLGKEIKVVTTKERRIVSAPSIKYREVVKSGLREIYDEDRVMDYISRIFDNEVKLNLNIDYIKREWYQDIRNELNLSNNRTKNNIGSEEEKPKKVIATTSYIRSNTSVVAEALIRSKNRCERCGKKAPVIDGNILIEFLEVYYKVPISDGGKDKVENMVILCPSCEREIKLGLSL